MSVRKSCSGLRSEPPANNNHSPHFHDKETQKDQVRKRTKTLYAPVKWKILHLLPLLTLCCSVWEPCLCGSFEMLDCVYLCPLGSLRWPCVALCGSVLLCVGAKQWAETDGSVPAKPFHNASSNLSLIHEPLSAPLTHREKRNTQL